MLNKVFSVDSPVSGKIVILEDGVERKLVVGTGIMSIYRSDAKQRGYWRAMVPNEDVKSALILGYGGGTTARALRHKFPDIKIIGYEIDPVIVEVAKQFLYLEDADEIRIADARQAFSDDSLFDLIIVDLYHEAKFVPFAEGKEFINQVHSKLSRYGLACFNRLFNKIDAEQQGEFDQALRSSFSEVWVQHPDLFSDNFIYWGRK